jgi:NADH-quinone oxidoreductase subunit L
MISWFLETPGRIYVLATLLPLATFVLLIVGGAIRALVRPYRNTHQSAQFIFFLFGGDRPLKVGANLATVTIGLAAILSFIGLRQYLADFEMHEHTGETISRKWAERATWAEVGISAPGKAMSALKLEIGYRIDHLTAIMFSMVTFISTCIFVFSLAYMKDETQEHVTDHEVHTDHGHFHRRGRYGRFFLYLSLFCFSMLNLLIADNLFQVFISWELVGVCSFFLIGFYYERHSASTAANKAFIVNRVGDAGFLIGLSIIWTYFGTFNFQEIFRQIDSGALPLSNTLWIIAGLGIFLGCVGKSAQFPLHTWLPDAMEGPTPVSALIHAATMVAAGVYLVGRCYPFFAPEVLLVIAYTGAITLFIAATIAVVMNDIKRVLAYSTVSQLGYMMLGLGVGGWVAGLLHLLTHAFFKALLFLCSGSVILGCHHEQDLRKMGGLLRKMPITAFTMLIGVLAIIGTPFFSGWYSKEQILGQAVGFGLVNTQHTLLYIIPMITAGLTAFYMFRLWLMAFTGKPRDHHVHEHAHESPGLMTIPLIFLALCSIGIAWGWPIWNVESSLLGQTLEHAQPESVARTYAAVTEKTHENHTLIGAAALGLSAVGVIIAILFYGVGRFSPAAVAARQRGLNRFLTMKWYFDELYSAIFVRPIVKLAFLIAAFDKQTAPADQAAIADSTIQPGSVDGFISAIGLLLYALGLRLRGLQSGLIRRYILVLALTTVVLFAILSFLAI